MSTVEFDNSGKKDERLEFVMEQTSKAVAIFTKAIKESTVEQEQISFKAFTLDTTKDEAIKVFDIIMTMVAMELVKQSPEFIKTITFFHSTESNEAGDSHSLFLHCDKTRTPPTKEELDAVKEKETFSVELVEHALNEVVELSVVGVEEVTEEQEEDEDEVLVRRRTEEVVEEVVEEVAGVPSTPIEFITLPHASLMSAYRRSGTE